MLSKKSFDAGCNPFTLKGPAVLGSGVPLPQHKPGTRQDGDCEAEFVYCALALGAVTNLQDGQLFAIDTDYNAVPLTTAAGLRGMSVGVGRVNQLAVAAGAYFIWLQIAGHAPVIVNTGTPNAPGETTANAGIGNFPNGAATVGAKTIRNLFLQAASVVFTANTAAGSPLLTAVSSDDNLVVGQAVAGNGIPANTTIKSITYSGGAAQITLSANATVSAQGVQVTATGSLPSNLLRPYIDQTN